MSVIVAVCVLVLALLVGVAIDDIGVRKAAKGATKLRAVGCVAGATRCANAKSRAVRQRNKRK